MTGADAFRPRGVWAWVRERASAWVRERFISLIGSTDEGTGEHAYQASESDDLGLPSRLLEARTIGSADEGRCRPTASRSERIWPAGGRAWLDRLAGPRSPLLSSRRSPRNAGGRRAAFV